MSEKENKELKELLDTFFPSDKVDNADKADKVENTDTSDVSYTAVSDTADTGEASGTFEASEASENGTDEAFDEKFCGEEISEDDISEEETENIEVVEEVIENADKEPADITIIGKNEWDIEEFVENDIRKTENNVENDGNSKKISDISKVSETDEGAEENAETDKEDVGESSEDKEEKTEANSGSEPNTDNSEAASEKEKKVGKSGNAEKKAEISGNISGISGISGVFGGPESGNDEDAGAKDESETEDVNERFMKRFIKGLIPWKGDSVFEVIRKIIFIIAVIVFVGAGIMLASTLLQSREAVRNKEEVSSVFESIMETTVVTTIDENGNVVTIPPTKEEIAENNFNLAEYFKKITPDYVGFIQLDGCGIQDPVVQTDNNDYYLTHTYSGGTNKGGSLFMDYRCTFTEDYVSPNIVIYGHNQEDETMFGNLKLYKQDVDFYAANPVVTLISERETYQYLIYGYFVTNALEKQDSRGEVFHYHDYIETLADENTFNWYLDQVKERNQIISPVDVKYGDKLLCLSTCSNEFSNSRFVVFARLLREDETLEDIDFSKAYLNPNARGVDWEAIMSGETTRSVSESEEETSETEETTETEEETSETEPPETTTVPRTFREITETTKRTIRKRPLITSKTTASESEETSDGDGSETGETDANGETPAETAPPESSEPESETVTAT